MANIDWVANTIQRLDGRTHSHAFQQDAAQPNKINAIISTDPPYYDNIGYADLSDFFYVWLRRSLQLFYPDMLATLQVPKLDELVATPYRHGGKDAAEKFFLNGMTRAIGQMANEAPVDSVVAIYYAFKQSETADDGTASTGWVTFLEATLSAGLGVFGTWPMRTELGNRMVSMGTNALASSVILVCRKRDPNATTITRADFRRALRTEMPAALRDLQHGNIAPVDVAQAAIGPGMGVYSRHAKVLEADGSAMTVRSALQLINEILDEHLTEGEGEFDSDTRFAITWYESHAFNAGPYGDAETLARARAVSVDGIAEAGIATSGGGKVRLIKRADLPADWDPSKDNRLTIWESTQHLIKRLEEGGESSAATLLAQLGTKAATARDLAYRLYMTCERKGWADEARAYNGLVIAWPDMEKLAHNAAAASPSLDKNDRFNSGKAQGELL